MPDPDRRRPILELLTAALEAVDPERAVRRVLHREGRWLIVEGQRYDLAAFERVIVLGAGKAGAPMARAAEAALEDVPLEGVVIVKEGHLAPVEQVALLEAAHPVPNQAGLDAGTRLLELAHSATARDLVIVLLSGGGSALLEVLPPGIDLEAVQTTTRLLLASGATIGEVNSLRKHLSQVKGGQVARALAPATVLTLVLSDVVGSPLDVIASGPTVPDGSTWGDAWGVVARYGLGAQLPAAVATRLQDGVAGKLPDTPKPGDAAFARTQVVIVGDNAVAAAAAQRKAWALGWNAQVLTTFLEGEAREVAKVVAALGREIQAHQRPLPPPSCLILGGETTVTLRGDGRGGRNQELALAAALALAGTEGITVVALATDGSDGPTGAAGGMVDGGTVGRARAAGLDPAHHLATNNALPLLTATHDLLCTGPTNTNVNDLVFVVVA